MGLLRWASVLQGRIQHRMLWALVYISRLPEPQFSDILELARDECKNESIESNYCTPDGGPP